MPPPNKRAPPDRLHTTTLPLLQELRTRLLLLQNFYLRKYDMGHEEFRCPLPNALDNEKYGETSTSYQSMDRMRAGLNVAEKGVAWSTRPRHRTVDINPLQGFEQLKSLCVADFFINKKLTQNDYLSYVPSHLVHDGVTATCRDYEKKLKKACSGARAEFSGRLRAFIFAKVLDPSFDNFPGLTLDHQYKFWRDCFTENSSPATYLAGKKVMIWLLEPFGVGIDLQYIFCNPHNGLTKAEAQVKRASQNYIVRFLSHMAQTMLTSAIVHNQNEWFGLWSRVYMREWEMVDKRDEVRNFVVEHGVWPINGLLVNEKKRKRVAPALLDNPDVNPRPRTIPF